MCRLENVFSGTCTGERRCNSATRSLALGGWRVNNVIQGPTLFPTYLHVFPRMWLYTLKWMVGFDAKFLCGENSAWFELCKFKVSLKEKGICELVRGKAVLHFPTEKVDMFSV